LLSRPGMGSIPQIHPKHYWRAYNAPHADPLAGFKGVAWKGDIQEGRGRGGGRGLK